MSQEVVMPQTQVGTHTLDVSTNWLGSEKVTYDGVLKTEGKSIAGRGYIFTVEEDGEPANYEVEFKAGLFSAHVTVRRNGVAIFTS